MPLPALTADQQIEVLGSLKQKAAAWLLGVNARTLRDRTDVESEGGRFNARDLLAIAGHPSRKSDLAVDEYELSLTVAELIASGFEGSLPTFSSLLSNLDDDRLLAFAQLLRDYCQGSIDEWPEEHEPPDEDQVRLGLESRAAKEFEEQTRRYYLRQVSVCEACHKIRNGRKWVHPSKLLKIRGLPLSAFDQQEDRCPKCHSRK